MPGGRPTKLTPLIQQRICDALRAGNHIETASAFAGVSKTTIHSWLRRGARASKGIYRVFSDAVDKALADAEARDVALIAKAASEGQWQAAAWRLERRYPEKWGRRDRHQVDANIHGRMRVNADDAVAQLARLLTSSPSSREEDKDP